MFDVKEFRSTHFQRVYQYLKLSKQGTNMDNFTFVPGEIDDDQKTCLSLLLRSVKWKFKSLQSWCDVFHSVKWCGLFRSKFVGFRLCCLLLKFHLTVRNYVYG